MFRYLHQYEIGILKKRFDYLVKLKTLIKNKNTEKFFKLELTLDEAIDTYLKHISVYYEDKSSTDDVDLIMKKYLEKESDIIKVFLDTAIEEKYAHRYSEDDNNHIDNIDNYFEDYADTVSFIYNFIRDMLPNKAMDIVDEYELIYRFYDEELFNKERGDLWFDHRKTILDLTGGIVKTAYWIPDRLKNADIEDILPDEDELRDLTKTECNSIAITNIVTPCICEKLGIAFQSLLYCTENSRLFSSGGLMSSFYTNNNNLFLDITSEDCSDLALGIFNIIAILMLKIKEAEVSKCENGKH